MIATTARGPFQVAGHSTSRPCADYGHKAAASVARRQSLCMPCTIDDGICNPGPFAKVINDLQPGIFERPGCT
jgi:hypothetical protein